MLHLPQTHDNNAGDDFLYTLLGLPMSFLVFINFCTASTNAMICINSKTSARLHGPLRFDATTSYATNSASSGVIQEMSHILDEFYDQSIRFEIGIEALTGSTYRLLQSLGVKFLSLLVFQIPTCYIQSIVPAPSSCKKDGRKAGAFIG